MTKPLRLCAWKESFLNSLPRSKCGTEGRRLGVRTVQNDHSAIERTGYIDVALYSVKPYNFYGSVPNKYGYVSKGSAGVKYFKF